MIFQSTFSPLVLAMRVLLVYARFPKAFWSFERAVSLMGHRALLPPLGLITMAALLPRSGISVWWTATCAK